MTYYLLRPEVAGQLGDATVMDRSVHPPLVTHLEYAFDGWMGDELLEAFSSFIVTAKLASLLEGVGLTGFRLADVDITLSEEYLDFGCDENLPEFRWLQITGRQLSDDFGLSQNGSLVASESTLAVLSQGQIDNCGIEAL